MLSIAHRAGIPGGGSCAPSLSSSAACRPACAFVALSPRFISAPPAPRRHRRRQEQQPRAAAAAASNSSSSSSGGGTGETPQTATTSQPPAASGLAGKKCAPCEAAADAEAAMGLRGCLDPRAAEGYLAHLEPGWRVYADGEGRLRLRRRYRAKSFVKGLELFQRVSAVAEAEGHHPDLALESWQHVTISVWTHERGGLTENDFILAAKIDAVDKVDLISKKPPRD